jgi:membrane dipeptidase
MGAGDITNPEIGGRTRALLRSAVLWDNHTCISLRADDESLQKLEHFRDAGVTVVSVNVGFGRMPWADHVYTISKMRRWITLRPDRFKLISTVSDVYRCKAERKLGIVFDVEGMFPVARDPTLVQTLYELGVRWMLIAYNLNNEAGGGCLDCDGGLTSVGRTVIDEMERVGMVLCLSHSGTRTAADALEYCRKPPIFSHSNPCGDTPHARNVSDHLMRDCARKGGVIGLSGVSEFLGGNANLVSRLLRQLRYVIDLVGATNVGLGLDHVFDLSELGELVRSDPAMFPASFSSAGPLEIVAPESIGEIAEGLARDNLSDAQIGGILGENWLRIATHCWR